MEKTFLIKHKIKRFAANFFPKKPIAGNLVVLTYHSVNLSGKCSVDPQRFGEQIKFIVENFNVMNLDKFDFSEPEKEKPFLGITFDDGYEDNFINAFPILKKYNLPATIFLSTGFVFGGAGTLKTRKEIFGDLKTLRPKNIEEMFKSGLISFGVHTATYPKLSELSGEKLKKEIEKPKNILEDFLGKEISLFAYPYGGKNDFNEKTISSVIAAGYKMAFSNIYGFNDLKHPNLFSLYRININYFDNVVDFKNKINGKWRFLKYLNR